MKTRKIAFKLSFDGSELTQFIEDNSEMEWDDICDLQNEFELYGDENNGIGYIRYDETLTVYNPTPRKIFYQEMVNKFFIAYELDKTKSIIVLFTD
jgi:hypothetical protein|tara:strand:+ start:1344 stop:1631 length:288 start_codon:yes stop_codon:yes gene_type:complete